MNLSNGFSRVSEEIIVPSSETFLDGVLYNVRNVTSAKGSNFSVDLAHDDEEVVSLSLAQTRFLVQTIITPVVVSVGLLGNVLNILVLVQPSMRTSTNVYLLVLAVADMVYLTFSFALSFVGCRRRGLSYAAYHFNTYGRTISDMNGNIAVWIIVIFTVERYVAVCHPMHGKVWCTVTRAKLFSLLATLFCLANTMPGLFELEVVVDEVTGEPHCQYTAFVHSPAYELGYTWWYATIFTFLPLVSLLIFNSLLIHALVRAARDRELMLSGGGGGGRSESRGKERRDQAGIGGKRKSRAKGLSPIGRTWKSRDREPVTTCPQSPHARERERLLIGVSKLSRDVSGSTHSVGSKRKGLLERWRECASLPRVTCWCCSRSEERHEHRVNGYANDVSCHHDESNHRDASTTPKSHSELCINTDRRTNDFELGNREYKANCQNSCAAVRDDEGYVNCVAGCADSGGGSGDGGSVLKTTEKISSVLKGTGEHSDKSECANQISSSCVSSDDNRNAGEHCQNACEQSQNQNACEHNQKACDQIQNTCEHNQNACEQSKNQNTCDNHTQNTCEHQNGRENKQNTCEHNQNGCEHSQNAREHSHSVCKQEQSNSGPDSVTNKPENETSENNGMKETYTKNVVKIIVTSSSSSSSLSSSSSCQNNCTDVSSAVKTVTTTSPPSSVPTSRCDGQQPGTPPHPHSSPHSTQSSPSTHRPSQSSSSSSCAHLPTCNTLRESQSHATPCETDSQTPHFSACPTVRESDAPLCESDSQTPHLSTCPTARESHATPCETDSQSPHLSACATVRESQATPCVTHSTPSPSLAPHPSPSPALRESHATLCVTPSRSPGRGSHRRAREQQKVTLMLIVIVAIFLLCQLPWTVLYIYKAYLSAHEQEAYAANTDALKIAGNVVNLLAQINASGNFYLYSFFSKKFRRTLAQLLFFWRRREGVKSPTVHL